MSNQVYDIITERILDQMDKGVCPWRMPWASMPGSAPHNIKGRKYSGCNFFLLSMLGYADPTFMTFNQAKAMGGSVKKGEKGTPVIFWKMLESVKDGKKQLIPMLRYYTVFNISQTEGVKYVAPVVPENTFTGIPAAEQIAAGFSGPKVQEGGNRACYSASLDMVTVPFKAAFSIEGEFYSTLFHELAHSTGHKSRLDRKEVGASTFGSEPYSLEELVAELTSSFLCAEAGIDNTLENSASYIKGWLSKLKDDPKAFITAAGRAQKAANFIMGKKAAQVEDEAA